jgi:hypothetical protein
MKLDCISFKVRGRAAADVVGAVDEAGIGAVAPGRTVDVETVVGAALPAVVVGIGCVETTLGC